MSFLPEYEAAKKMVACKLITSGHSNNFVTMWEAKLGSTVVAAPTRIQAVEECLNMYFLGTHAHADTVRA